MKKSLRVVEIIKKVSPGSAWAMNFDTTGIQQPSRYSITLPYPVSPRSSRKTFCFAVCWAMVSGPLATKKKQATG